MGTERYSSVLASKLIEEVPNNTPSTIQRAILTGTSIADQILAANLGSYAIFVDKYFRYGRDHWIWGLPNGSLGFSGVTPIMEQNIIDVIEKYEIGGPIDETTINTFQGHINPDYYIKQYMIHNWNWTSITDEVSLYPLGVQPVKYTGYDYLEITKQYQMNFTDTNGANFSSVIPVPNTSNVWFMADYQIPDQPGRIFYWAYDPATNRSGHEKLIIDEGSVLIEQYYPIVPIIENNFEGDIKKVWIDGEWNGYRQQVEAKKMLDYLGIDMKEMTESIQADQENFEYVDDAFIVFGTDIKTKNPASLRYLYKYFKYLKQHSTDYQVEVTTTTITGSYANITTTSIQNKIIISEAADNFNSEIRFTKIDETVYTGIFGSGKIGETAVAYGYSYQTDDGKIPPTYTNNPGWIEISYQINTTQYEKIRMWDPAQITTINGGGGPLTRSLFDNEATGVDSGFFFPMSREVLKSLKRKDEEACLYDSLQLIVYTKQKIKTKWYESTLFGIVLKVFAVVLLAFQQYWAVTTATAAGTTAAAVTVWSVIETVVIGIAVSFAAKLVAEQFGVIGVIVASVIALAAGMYQQYSVAGIKGLPFADKLIGIATSIAKGAKDFISEEMSDLIEDFAAFSKEADDLQEEIDRINKQLDPNWDMLEILDPMRDQLQSDAYYHDFSIGPDILYNLPINMADVTFDAIHNYVDNSLSLPTPYESMVVGLKY